MHHFCTSDNLTALSSSVHRVGSWFLILRSLHVVVVLFGTVLPSTGSEMTRTDPKMSSYGCAQVIQWYCSSFA